jgi:hypothetical protein
VFASSHRHRLIDEHLFYLLPLRFCHALCASDVAFLRTSVIPLTSQLVLARSWLAKIFCGGKAVASHAPLFVRALFLAGSPRNPRTPARARMVLTVMERCRKSSSDARCVVKTGWMPEGKCKKRQHQKRRTKLGGRFSRKQGQALRVLKKKFLMCLIDKR